MEHKTGTNDKLNLLTNLLEIFEPLEEQATPFSDICKFVRKSFDASQKEMAVAFKITERAYQYWEEGKRVPKGFQAFKLWRLYQALKEGVPEENLSKAISQLYRDEAA